MLRKAFCIMVMLLTLPAMASAYNCWYVTRSASPTSLLPNVTPPVNSPIPGYNTLTGSTTTNMTATASTTCGLAPASAAFTVAAPAGYTVSSVKVDGVVVGSSAGSYTVNKAGRISHSIAVTYATQRYTITTTPAAGGTISPSVTVAGGASATINVIPGAGYQLSSVTIDGTTYSGTDPVFTDVQTAGSYTFTNIQASHTLTAAFAAAPSATVRISTVGGTVNVGTAIAVDGTPSTASNPAATWTWTVSPTTGVTPTTASGKTATFTPSAVGTYTFTLTAGNTGLTSDPSASVSFTVQNPVEAANNICLNCHATDDNFPGSVAAVAGYNASPHAGAKSCQDCHNPGGTQSHHYNVTRLTVDTLTFKALTTAGPAAKGEYFCLANGCHVPTNIWGRDLSQSSHFANIQNSQCSSCHGTDMHAQDGEFDNKCGRCHAGTLQAGLSKHATAITEFSCRSCHTGTVGYGYNATPTVVGSSMSFTRPSSARASKHRPETFKYATSDACATCHAGVRTEFRATAHWNSHLESGPEFAGGAVEGQLNANESWTTTEDGAAVTCYKRCHFKPNLGQDPKATDSSTNGGLRPGKDECVACHDPHKLVATYQTTCMTCHNGSKHGKVPNEFWNSAHWNNHLESGPEFTNQMDSVLTTGTTAAGGTVTYPGTTTNGILNANDSFTTTENGSVVTCAYRCHFRPGLGPNQNVAGQLVDGHSVNNVSYVDTLNNVTYTRPGGNACMACHDAHGLEAGYQTCLMCHSGSKHGKVPNEFWASKHWVNNLETGSEFANQMDITTVGANVKNNGGTVAGVLNANDSYTTTENGTTVTCAYRCHFRPGMYPDTVTPPSNYINPISKKAITYVMYSSPYGAGKFYRPGGNACMACHDAHGLEANARSTCYTCHAGGNHGWSVKAFEKSSHFTGTYAIADGIGGPTGEACTACHNAHSLEAEFANLSTANTLHTAGLATGCQKCHTPGQTYGIFDATGAGTAPHYSPDVLTTAYVTSRTTCADCHSHNNTINSGWAEGGHGSLSSPAFTGDPAENFKTMGVAGNYQTDPSLRNCVRCHTAKGAMNFVTSGFTSVAAVGTADDNTSEPLVCSGCHNNVDKGTLPLANFTSQHNGGGYTARYGYKNRLANNTLVNTAIYLGNMKNSNICAPCHSQRASGQEIKDVFALGSFKQYSAGSAIYPHIAQPAAILAGKGAYEFVPFTAPVEGHITNAVANSNGTGTTQGPCVACHMNGLKPHNLEIDATSFTKNCSKCHGSAFDQAAVDAAKVEFDAAVAVVGNMLVANGISIDGINPLPERTAFDMSLGATSNRYAVAEKNMGAWFNWYLFAVSDPAAFAHNPAYAKKMIQDTIDYLAHGTVTGSIADVPEAAGLNLGAHPVQGSNTCTSCHNQAAAAADCIGCHDISRSATTADLDNDGVRAIMPEFNKRSHHVTGGTPTNAQCAVCHAEGTASNPTRTSSYHMSDGKVYLRDVDHAGAVFAWDGTNHTAMDNFCFACHDADGAADVATITALNPAATAMNPFADTLTNGYDMVARTGVVDVKTAFDPANASHHAVLQQKYQYRFSNRDNAEAWKTRNSSSRVILDSELAAGKIVDGETVEFPETGLTYDPAGPEDGGEATLYEADKFVATYMPLGASENVGDNSQLHCGDCHTVGQWKANSSTNADGTATADAIGAHGSANEYMLRNALGTDALHNARTLVCFNCHKTTFPVGNVTNYNQVTGYATAHSVSAFHGQCIADSMLQIGTTNRLQFSERVDRQATWSTADGATSTNAASGNITGISCTNCHNSGLRAGWGGIHGGNNTYTDGLGNVQQTYRFMPGMGNYRYAPPGGWDGKDLTDPTLVTKAAAGVGANKGMGGCYTNSALTGTDPNTGYGACSHHGTSTAKSYKGAVPVDVINGTQRDSYGGGTTGSPTAAEPTVREATGGNTLVTRPLKY